MQAVARLESVGTRNRRAAVRHKLHLGSTLPELGESVLVHDLSSSGMLIETSARLPAFGRLEVELPELGTVTAVVIWSSGRFFGCQFEIPVARSRVSAARLRSSTAQLPQGSPAFDDGAGDADGDDGAETSDRWPLRLSLPIVAGTSLALWWVISRVIAVL